MSIERKTKMLWIRNPKGQDFHFTDLASAEQQNARTQSMEKQINPFGIFTIFKSIS